MADVQTFASFSGSDIHAVFGDFVFGEIQMISYKQDREKAPVYTMGSAELRTIARGKRLITGACVFVMFDKDGLLGVMNQRDASMRPHINKSEVVMAGRSTVGSSQINQAIQQGGSLGAPSGNTGAGFTAFNEQVEAFHLDQLLPFDITVVGANEYGKISRMIIKGVELMTEAGGMSIDDMVLEKQVAFIARRIEQWTPVQKTTNRNIA